MNSVLSQFKTSKQVIEYIASNPSYYGKKISSVRSNIQKPILNHTCLRVKDPVKSINFYQDVLNFKLISVKKFPQWGFDLYFLSQNKTLQPEEIFSVEGILELTHNYGTETDPNYVINNGNDPTKGEGFGHICVSTFDVQKLYDDITTKFGDSLKFQTKLNAPGSKKGIFFLYDPDKYSIEVFSYGNRANHSKDEEERVLIDQNEKFNHTMIRVVDPVKAISFYTNVLGMSLLDVKHNKEHQFSLYFIGYNYKNYESGVDYEVKGLLEPRRVREGTIQLRHYWGTENLPDFKYHSGNEDPQGFGHTCVAFENASKVCEEIEQVYGDSIQWAPKWGEGGMKNIAFIKDADAYKIEFVNKKGV
ncbi:glyoxalase-domain-containing protein [Hanseniaspora valbyensis NRRL Y-1626]|uniref:lactoylglutathione lyase n=1 Tax=Hanseniaspora valbyensis NRRL Y-1626 TaxID=766949 RepID=A0A1B7TAW2_9ASCO|nr:glyoxalase-domain-containing protein [Hanseniaspora valbyensis NRRL Y-1626]